MDSKKQMIIIDNKIETKNILLCEFNEQSNKWSIKYVNSNKLYYFSKNRIFLLQNPKILTVKDYYFYLDNKLNNEIKEIYEFEGSDKFYYHVIFKNGKNLDCDDKKLKKICKNSYNFIEYMKKVSEVTSLKKDNGEKLLCKSMNKVNVSDLDSALANYLGLSKNLIKENNMEILIFPFGCNSSQYAAVKNAIYNKISVIEGPPGTGKTQTILNIIANIIIRNMNCQVASNNNPAIRNILEKLEKYDLSFFVALLGKRKNKDSFLLNQDIKKNNFDNLNININITYIENELKNMNQVIIDFYNTKKELANLIQKRNELELEYKYFNELIRNQHIDIIDIKRCNTNKLKTLWNELICINNISIFNKIKYLILYKTGNLKFYNNDINVIIKSIQNKIYTTDLSQINSQIKEKQDFINNNESLEERFIELSMNYFKKYLSTRYNYDRKIYTSEEIWKNPSSFIKDYPVVLSTTYSSRNTFNDNFKFDYIIMDESSQIDLVTGTLALSSANFAVIIGDEKQLPNVVPKEVGIKSNKIYNEYKLDKCYSYSINSFLTSVKNAIPNIANIMLVEHYRCHPKIINFCNKKFYNDKLVIMTKDNGEKDVVKIIKTKKGNFCHDLSNQRQIDTIKEIISKVRYNDVGIIAPYNNQVELIKENISDFEVNTIHKFQGREKDAIIISTVDDNISPFVGDAKILNVAISRAKNQLFFIVTGNDITDSNVRDFIGYVDYNNMEIINSKIYSSFDILYKQYELERLEFFKKHNKILKYDSENIIYYLIKRILDDYDNLEFHVHQSLNDLINDKSLLNEDEKKYASHPNTHIDFYIFRKFGDEPILAIEVDGYNYHKKGTKQYERDLLKNSILEKYDIPLIRLNTSGSSEESLIRKKLDSIVEKKNTNV